MGTNFTIVTAIVTVTLLTGVGTFLVGLLLLIARYRSYYRYLALFLIGIGVSRLGEGVAFLPVSSPFLWESAGLFGEALLPAFLLSFASSLAQGSGINLGGRIQWKVWILYGTGVMWASGSLFGLLYQIAGASLPGDLAFDLTLSGAVYELFLIVGLTIGIMHVETVLSSLRDPILHRVKWILLGSAGLAGAEVVKAVHTLLLGQLTGNIVLFASIVTLFALMLFIAGLLRIRLQVVTGSMYVSPHVLQGSLTLIVIGAYLLMVGIASEWVRKAVAGYGTALGYATIFVAIVTLLVLFQSRTVRLRAKTFVARHFYRSRYDYRAKWREVTEAFQLTTSVDSILDKLIEVLSQTFGAGRISIWMVLDADGSFHQVRSINTIKETTVIPSDHPLIDRLRCARGPLDMEEALATDDPFASEFQSTTNAALLVPLVAGENLMAFAVLSENPKTKEYATDDKDLVQGIAHHAAALLSHAALSEERTAGVELKALHQFSAFCLHDIKNLAARLSLVVQNAQVLGHDQAFQQSAMQTVERTVAKMTELISKIAAASPKDEAPTLVNIGASLQEMLQGLGGSRQGMQVDVLSNDSLTVRADREQLQQVLFNLVLNARQATGGFEGIRVTARRSDSEVRIEVRDNGPGMDVAQLRTLFRPFKTTKAGGLGIGLYQCRKIIERLGGRLLISSQVGKGTTALIELPLVMQTEVVSLPSARGKVYGDH